MVFRPFIEQALRELSDDDYQVRIWLNIDNNLDEMSSLEEASSRLFDDSRLNVALSSNYPPFPQDVTDKLLELKTLLGRLYYTIKYPADLQSSSMQRVRSLATELLDSLPW